jgi:hypothetical protein
VKITAFRLFAGAFGVYALGGGENGEDCPTQDFLNELKQNNSPDFGRLVRYLSWSSGGLLRNDEHFKAVGEGIYEFRGRNGARLFCFLDAGALLLCTNGYVKKKQKLDPTELERAKKWRTDYLTAKRLKTLTFK